MGITALTIGLLSIAVTLIFDAGFLLAAPMSVVALVLGVLSLRTKATATGDELRTGGQWTGKAGVVVCSSALILAAFWWVPFVRTEIVLYRLHRPARRVVVSDLVKEIGQRSPEGTIVEVAGAVANVQHMPGHATIALRSESPPDGWTVVCAPIGSALPSPEPRAGEPLAVRGQIKRIDTEMAMVFGRQIMLDPCVVLR